VRRLAFLLPVALGAAWYADWLRRHPVPKCPEDCRPVFYARSGFRIIPIYHKGHPRP
jgi:hypothetical protein